MEQCAVAGLDACAGGERFCGAMVQLVEVESGPLERAFGLATVTLKTASPETGARIPGLSPEEATRPPVARVGTTGDLQPDPVPATEGVCD